MRLTKGTLSIRPLQQGDEVFLLKWLTDDQVLEYYEGRDQNFTEDRIVQKFFQEDPSIARSFIKYNNQPIGYVQYYQIDEIEKKRYGYSEDQIIYGMDQFIGEVSYWGKGLGTRFISLVLHYLLKIKHADGIVMDPQIRNTRAIHCYGKCGFKQIKVLPEHELHEGVYEDCLLMAYERKNDLIYPTNFK